MIDLSREHISEKEKKLIEDWISIGGILIYLDDKYGLIFESEEDFENSYNERNAHYKGYTYNEYAKEITRISLLKAGISQEKALELIKSVNIV